MIWVLVAVSLKFSAAGEIMSAQTYSRYESKAQCEKMLGYVQAEVAKASPKTYAVVQCVQMKREANA